MSIVAHDLPDARPEREGPDVYYLAEIILTDCRRVALYGVTVADVDRRLVETLAVLDPATVGSVVRYSPRRTGFVTGGAS